MEMKTRDELLSEIEALKAENRELKSLSLSKLEYNLVLEYLHAGVVIHEADTSILYANPAAHELLDLSPEEMQGTKAIYPQWHFIGLDEKLLPIEKYPVNLVFQSNRPISNYIIGVHRPRMNDTIWVMTNGVPIFKKDSDEIDRVIITFIDVTRQQIKQSEQRLRTIIDTTPLGICITDENGYFEYVNPAYLKLYKYEYSELIGKHFTIVVPDEQKDILSNLHDKFIQTSFELRGEWNVIDRLGETLTILADAAKITGTDGKPRKVTFVMDITEKKKLELLREDVGRIMRHDLKTPLSGIIGFPQLMLEDENLSDEQREYLKLIESSGKKMRDMINLSLDMYKMETGTYELEAVPVDIVSVLKECMTDLNTQADKRNVSVELYVDSTNNDAQPVQIYAEKLLLYSLFSNLLLNAIEASPPMETVLIKIEVSKDTVVIIHNKGAVPERIRASFFEKYSSGHKRTGSGLGTYSARLYANTMGGDIKMTTSNSDGTSLIVSFPRMN